MQWGKDLIDKGTQLSGLIGVSGEGKIDWGQLGSLFEGTVGIWVIFKKVLIELGMVSYNFSIWEAQTGES
jgi:hypothetical protein